MSVIAEPVSSKDRRNITHLLQVQREAKSSSSSAKREVFGDKKGMCSKIFDFVHPEASSFKLQNLNSDASRTKYLVDLKKQFLSLNSHAKDGLSFARTLSSLTILRCVQRRTFNFPPLQREYNANGLLKRCLTVGSSICRKTAKCLAIFPAFLAAAIVGTIVRYPFWMLEKKLTGYDRQAAEDEFTKNIDKSQLLISESTGMYMFIYVPAIAACVAFLSSRILNKFSEIEIQSRLIKNLARTIGTTLNQNRTDFSKKSIERDQELLTFLKTVHPPQKAEN